MSSAVIAAHDPADYGLRFAVIGEDGLFAAPDDGQPLARHDELRPDRDGGEEAVEIGQAHAVRRRAVGTEIRLESLGADANDRDFQCAHGCLRSPHDDHAMRGVSCESGGRDRPGFRVMVASPIISGVFPPSRSPRR